ncbi:hypothetical protein [Xylanibacillus composti]|uniref:Uncharacterized protein n=1 Tax=Xylanibacillus composti TaxID=1572762 RepID=A0A8J4H7T6_9BACL|nr:hypothetical protein [Xylanibacillus composti]GIQ70569.1 hypothetical protein XYCOK13_33930 [Xylanibacillus composti]
MSYTCHFCEHESESAHSVTVYEGDGGSEERLELLCDECYEDWLLSLKG